MAAAIANVMVYLIATSLFNLPLMMPLNGPLAGPAGGPGYHRQFCSGRRGVLLAW
jgi:hypothetical protein